MTEQAKEALGNGCLQEGEYLIPNGYSVKKVGRTLQVYKSKDKRLGDGEYQCKDCKHYVSGYSINSAWYETKVCELLFKRTTKEGRPCAAKSACSMDLAQYGDALREIEEREEAKRAAVAAEKAAADKVAAEMAKEAESAKNEAVAARLGEKYRVKRGGR